MNREDEVRNILVDAALSLKDIAGYLGDINEHLGGVAHLLAEISEKMGPMPKAHEGVEV